LRIVVAVLPFLNSSLCLSFAHNGTHIEDCASSDLIIGKTFSRCRRSGQTQQPWVFTKGNHSIPATVSRPTRADEPNIHSLGPNLKVWKWRECCGLPLSR
jgi:hypothetical protein